MNALVRKELRLLLPAWGAALVLAVAPSFLFSHSTFGGVVSLTTFGLGVLLLALTPFGREFNLGTFSHLLAQPVPRWRLWGAKILALAIALISILAVWSLCDPLRTQGVPGRTGLTGVWQTGASMVLAAFVGGLWTTLLFRQVAAAFWFCILTPALVTIGVEKLLANQPKDIQSLSIVIASIAYLAVGFLWARRLFMRAQDIQWTGGIVTFPSWLKLPGRADGFRARHTHRPFWALVGKELQFHQTNLLIGAGLLLMHVVVIWVCKSALASGSKPSWLPVLQAMGTVWLGVPWLTGCAAVAEERRLGTMSAQLCVPVARRWQFAVKLAMAMFWGVLLGGVVFWLLESVARELGVRSWIVQWPFELRALKGLVAASAVIVGISFYASTLTRNTLQALGASIVIGVSGMYLFAAAHRESYGSGMTGLPLWRGPLLFYLGWPAIGLTLLALAYSNYKQLHLGGRVWLRNTFAVVSALVVVFAATAFVYHRAWELLTPLEPRHGPARLSGLVRPKICPAGLRTFVLLPDGRLWATKNSRFQEINEYVTSRDKSGREHKSKARILLPADGEFVAGSNWVDMASAIGQVVGVQSDGSLWQIPHAPPPLRTDITPAVAPQRIGTDVNWKSLAAGSGHFLALKRDGSLWGWGLNNAGQLGPGPKSFTNGPVRIGTESDWMAIYAYMGISAGLKRDGSLWKWGAISRMPDGTVFNKPMRRSAPIRWSLEATNVTSFFSDHLCDIAVRKDGSVWAVGQIPGNWLKESRPLTGFARQPVRLGIGSEWRDAVFKPYFFVALKSDGSLRKGENTYGYSPPAQGERGTKKLSEYSDWIAIATLRDYAAYGVVALAADGTLCCWTMPSGRSDSKDLLAPTRRPLWNMNIFAASRTLTKLQP